MDKIIVILFLIMLSSCASINTPNRSLIDNVPVIKIGESRDAPKDHIVFIPANAEFPIKFSISGTAFNKHLSSTVIASFKKDLYLYKYWASFDGKHWENSHKLINVEPSGGFDKSGGKIHLNLDFNR